MQNTQTQEKTQIIKLTREQNKSVGEGETLLYIKLTALVAFEL